MVIAAATVSRIALAVLVAAAALVSVAPARAATISEGFDAFANGTVLTTQVAGVRFLDGPVVFSPALVVPASPPRAIRSAVSCTNSLLCPNGAWRQDIEFDRPALTVTVKVGKDEGGCFEFDCTKARMLGYDASGTIVADSRAIAADVDAEGAFDEALRVQAPTFTIKRVRVMFGLQDGAPGALPTGAARAQIDDLSATVLDPGATAPPPAASPPPPRVTVLEPAAGLVTDQRQLNVRASVVVTGAPTALCARVDAPPALPADCGSQSLGADRTAAFFVRDLAVGPHVITVFARDGVGQVGSASVTVEIVRDLGVDIETDLLDISQAVQELTVPRLLRENRPADASIPYQHREYAYAGVPLVRSKRTVVRLLARLRSSGRVGGDSLPAPRALLHGLVRGGRPLPGSPLEARFRPARIDRAPLGERRGTSAAAYEFVVPSEWTRSGPIQIVGEVNPQGLPGVSGTYSECDGCRFDNAYRMGISFTDGRAVGVASLKVLYPGVRLPRSPYPAYYRFDQISPVRLDVTPWLASVYAGDLAASDSDTVVWRVQGAKDMMGIGLHTIGLHDGRFRGLTVTYGGFGGFLDLVPEDAAAASIKRPLTSTAHELVHLFGSPHAGTRCPDDGTPGDWPPEQRGEIGGWALDPSSARPGQPSRVFGKHEPGSFEPPEGSDRVVLYDLMSYCVTDLTNESDAWIAPRRWRELAAGGFQTSALRPAGVDQLGPDYVDRAPHADNWPRSAASRAHTARSVAGAGADRSLAVTAIVKSSGDVRIVDARPSPLPVSRTLKGAPYTLAALTAAGARLAGVSAAPVILHDHGAPGTQQLLLRANLPLARNIGAVQFTDGAGAVKATRKASVHPPSVKLLAPRARGRIAGALRVSWRASDADGESLRASVELSADGGRRWRARGVDVRGSSFVIPAAQVPATRRGRVRVRVNDGLHTTTAISGRLLLIGGAPQIVPLVGAADRRPRGDERVTLAARAWDSSGLALRGGAIRWTSRGRPLGSGEQLSVPAASLGSTITITARDAAGRTARTKVSMRVRGVAPAFLRLTPPVKVSRTARTLSLRVAANLPALLTARAVGAAPVSAPVDRAVRSVVIAVRPGSGPVSVSLRLKAGGRTSRAAFAVPRP